MSTWTPVAPMTTAHFALAAATALPFGPPNAQGVREPFPFDGRLYAIGGSLVLDEVEAYTPRTNTWAAATPMPTARFGLAVAVGADGNIYAVGGRNNPNSTLNTLEAYIPTVGLRLRPGPGVWTDPLAPMPTARSGLAAAAGRDGRIYALGGSDGGAPLSVVEAYDPSQDAWTTVAPMTTARDGLAAATGPDGRIYALGGFDGQRVLDSVEAYDPGTNTWTAVASMSTPRDGPAAATGPDGRIYALGGSQLRALNTVEAYDPTSNRWSGVASMSTTRSQLAAATGPDGRIYALGGVNLFGVLNTVEAYTI